MIHLTDCNIENGEFYVAVPILKPYPAEGVDEGLQENILREIECLEGAFFVEEVKIGYRSVRDIEPYNHITQRLSPKRYGNSRMFVFRMSISNATSLLKPYDKWSAQQNYIISILSYLDTFVYSLAYALGVYCDGTFDVDDFITYFNDEKYGRGGGLLNMFPRLHEEDESLYKTSSDISFQDALNWFLSIDDVKNACGKTALGKSLSIYSRMFSSFSSDEDLFMSGLLSVMALEALYESNGSKKVLAEKIVAFLKIDKQECEMDIKKIYHHRSSVAHGGFEFPFKFNAPDGSKDFERLYDKTIDSFKLGLRYLFKSYRKMILLNKKELSFAYECL